VDTDLDKIRAYYAARAVSRPEVIATCGHALLIASKAG
jgi:hypothetical protein